MQSNNSSSTALSKRPCHHGARCVKFGCHFTHPAGRRTDCHFGAGCTKGASAPCAFLHPKPAGGAAAVACRRPAGGGGAAGSSTMHAKATEVTITHKKVEVARAPRDVVVVLDTSGSMSGGKLTAAVAGVKAIAEEGLIDLDTFTFWSFSSTATKQLPKTEKAALDGLLGPVLESIKAGGRTAFFDTVKSAKAEMSSAAGRSLMLVALTDGADNTSTACDLAGLAAELAKPGLQSFKFIGIAVGAEAVGYVEPLCVPQCCSLIEAADGAEAITAAFGKALKMINQTTKVTKVKEIIKVVEHGLGVKQLVKESETIETSAGGKKHKQQQQQQLAYSGRTKTDGSPDFRTREGAAYREQQLPLPPPPPPAAGPKLKAVLCSNWSASGACPFGAGCHFAHGQQELGTVAPASPGKGGKGKAKVLCRFGHGCKHRDTCTFVHPAAGKGKGKAKGKGKGGCKGGRGGGAAVGPTALVAGMNIWGQFSPGGPWSPCRVISTTPVVGMPGQVLVQFKGYNDMVPLPADRLRR